MYNSQKNMLNVYCLYIYIYIKISSQKRHVLWSIILNIKTHINFSQIFRLFSKPSTVCVCVYVCVYIYIYLKPQKFEMCIY